MTISLSGLQQSPDFQLLTNQLTIQPSISSFATKDIFFEGLANVSPSEAKCSKLVNTNVTLRFQEDNLDYTVVDSRAPLHYEVRIVDSFVQQVSKSTCVSYCLETNPGLGTFIFGPDLSPDAASCPQTSCAAPSAYHPQPSCGNDVLNLGAGEECDGTDFGVYADGVGQCSVFSTQFVSGNLSCNAAGTANECKINTGACVQQLCGNGIIDAGSGEVCDPGINPETVCASQSMQCIPAGTPRACTCAPSP